MEFFNKMGGRADFRRGRRRNTHALQQRTSSIKYRPSYVRPRDGATHQVC